MRYIGVNISYEINIVGYKEWTCGPLFLNVNGIINSGLQDPQLNMERKCDMSKKDYETRTEELLIPIVEKFGVTIYDVEFVKEGSEYYLRAFIDKDGGVTIDDCENVSRALSDEMDKNDFISEAYILEVSSPGLGRSLKKERHYLNSLGEEVEIKTYKPIGKDKEFIGILKSYENDTVTIETKAGDLAFTKDMIANARLTIDF